MASAAAWRPRMAALCCRGAGPKGASELPSPRGTGIEVWTVESSGQGQKWPPRRRLLRRSEFRTAYAQGLRRSSAHFTVFALARPVAVGDQGVRFGITVSRKLGGAVARNRLRRRTRELLRRQRSASEASAGTCSCDMVVHPRPGVADAPMEELAAELAELVAKAQSAAARTGRNVGVGDQG